MSVDKNEAERFKEQGFAPYLSLRVNDNFFLKYNIFDNCRYYTDMFILQAFSVTQDNNFNIFILRM